jgi:hypothetical protein
MTSRAMTKSVTILAGFSVSAIWFAPARERPSFVLRFDPRHYQWESARRQAFTRADIDAASVLSFVQNGIIHTGLNANRPRARG